MVKLGIAFGKAKRKNISDKGIKLEIELVKIKYVKIPNKLQTELKELNEIQVVDKNLHKIKKEKIGDYAGEFEISGKLSIGDLICETQFRFRNINEYESYINSIDEGYNAQDAIFNDFFLKNQNSSIQNSY